MRWVDYPDISPPPPKHSQGAHGYICQLWPRLLVSNGAASLVVSGAVIIGSPQVGRVLVK